jgi:hypothetical protein
VTIPLKHEILVIDEKHALFFYFQDLIKPLARSTARFVRPKKHALACAFRVKNDQNSGVTDTQLVPPAELYERR